MRSKNLVILTAIVLVVAAYIFLFERHQPTSDEARKNAEKIFPDFDQDAVTAIRIEGGTTPVRIEKTGEIWRLREPFDFPADSSAVSSALGSIARLDADRRLAADESDPAAYGLDQPTVTVRRSETAMRSSSPRVGSSTTSIAKSTSGAPARW